MTKENLLVTLADRNYVEQAKQLFSSVYWNAGWKGDYMLLAHEIPEKDLKWFRDKGILIKKCKPLYDKMTGSYPPVVFDKFYLFTPEFKKWKNIIYLDADIIVRASIDNLADIKGIASSSPLGQKLKFHFYSEDNNDEIKEITANYNLNKRPFNSAMMFFSTSIIQDDTFEKIFSLFNRYKNISLGDDPIINLFFYEKWINLPPVYNVCVNYFQKYFPKKGIILHFARSSDRVKLPSEKDNIFYNEWKRNLEKAEFIDLNKIPEGRKFTKFEIFRYSLYLRITDYTCRTSKKISVYLANAPDRLIGQIGILIKKINPRLYYKLKKIKDDRK